MGLLIWLQVQKVFAGAAVRLGWESCLWTKWPSCIWWSLYFGLTFFGFVRIPLSYEFKFMCLLPFIPHKTAVKAKQQNSMQPVSKSWVMFLLFFFVSMHLPSRSHYFQWTHLATDINKIKLHVLKTIEVWQQMALWWRRHNVAILWAADWCS